MLKYNEPEKERSIMLSKIESNKLATIVRDRITDLIQLNLSYPGASGLRHDIKLLNEILNKLEE